MPPRAALGVPALAVLVALVTLGAAQAAELTGTDGQDRLVGTPRADTIRGRAGNDRIEGRAGGDLLHGGPGRDTVLGHAGPDRIALQSDGARDSVACGLGVDVVNAEHHDVVGDDCEVVTRQLSRDPFTGIGQHETQVEPDSTSFGSTIVAVFQSGRIFDGGAEGTGWATSVDAGRTWRRGFLERVADRVSDPVVAYDRVHRTWLIGTLAVTATAGGESSQLLVSRSPDGIRWSRSVTAADDPTEDYDKEWLGCDTWASSPFAGRCYLVYLDAVSGEIRTRRSIDGGSTWSAPVTAPVASPLLRGNGAYPVVRPDGALLIFFSVYGTIDPSADSVQVARSVDGGATFESSRRVASLFTEDIALRAPPFVSADVDSVGTVYATWADCRFSAQCTENSIVLVTSRDGIAWTQPRRVPFGPGEAAVDRFVPAIAVDPSARARGSLAIVAYAVTQSHGCATCQVVDASLIRSLDGGATWRAPVRLNAESIPLDWVADTGLGRMLADYISVSYVGGRPVPVVSLATEPVGGELRQSIYATTRLP
jgi:hypothetical protein